MTRFTARLLGTATVLLEYGDHVLITDPALDPAGGSYDVGFTTLTKTEPAAVTAEDLPGIDVALVSHDQHADNLDTSGRALLSSVPVTLTTTEGAARLGGGAVGLAPDESHRVGGLTVTAVPAQHGPEAAVPVVGPVVGFVITSPDGPTVYVSGDTVPFAGTEELVREHAGAVDDALIHAGAVAEGEGDERAYFSMTAAEAASLAERLGATRFSLIHADSWEHFTERMPRALEVAAQSPVADRLVDLSSGDPLPFWD